MTCNQVIAEPVDYVCGKQLFTSDVHSVRRLTGSYEVDRRIISQELPVEALKLIQTLAVLAQLHLFERLTHHFTGAGKASLLHRLLVLF